MILKWDYYSEQELKQKTYGFFLTLYPDSKTYDCQKVLDWVKEDAEAGEIYMYAYILHDKDEGDKPHYHIAIKYRTRRYLRAFLIKFMLWNYNPNQYDTCIRNWKSTLNYLIHNTKASEHKYQYSEDEVISNIPETIYSLRRHKDDEDIFRDIVDYIYNPDFSQMKLKWVFDYCLQNEDRYMYVYYKKSYLITNMIKEKNQGCLT